MKRYFAALTFISFLLLSACESGENRTLVSKHFGNESHNVGKNCMSCHKEGGEGEGWFEVAGTVYDISLNNTLGNGTVKLYSGPNGSGELKHTIEVDEKGNFFSTDNIEISSGLYAAVEGDSVFYMPTMLTSGACNSCHGVTTAKIYSK